MTPVASRAARILLLCGLTSIGIYGGFACDDLPPPASPTGATSSTGTGGSDAHPGLIYEGDANDAAYAAITAKDGPENPATYAIFDAPAEGAVYTVSSTPTFTWHMNAQPGPGARNEGGDFLLHGAPPAHRASLGPLLDLFGCERDAAAEGSSVNGLGYLLLFSSEKDAKLLRVFTTKTSYAPDPAAMEIMKGIGTVQVWILTGLFKNDALTADGGPFRGPWTAFEITQ
ncbi:MAG: hypothetical protein ABJE95_05870 [Byssovorax sp.]